MREFTNAMPMTIKILCHIEDGKEYYPSKISKDLNITYSHVAKIIDYLIDLKLVIKEKIGRKKIIKISAKCRNNNVLQACRTLEKNIWV